MKRILFAAAAAASVLSTPVFAREDNTYLWLHPKLGPQRVDRATNAPPRRVSEPASTSAPNAKDTAPAEAPKYWVDLKGNVRRIPVQSSNR